MFPTSDKIIHNRLCKAFRIPHLFSLIEINYSFIRFYSIKNNFYACYHCAMKSCVQRCFIYKLVYVKNNSTETTR